MHQCCGPVDTTAPIAVTINPEARVIVARTAARLGAPAPGVWHPIDVTIVNDGFVTGPLTIDSDPVRGVELDLPMHQLTGAPRQEGGIRVRFDAPGAADVTLTFRALAALGGLAQHSTLSLLLRSEAAHQPRGRTAGAAAASASSQGRSGARPARAQPPWPRTE